MLIGLSGKAGVGKDTVAQRLVDEHGFVRYAFADAVREIACAINPIIMTNWVASESYENPKLRELRLNDYLEVHGWDWVKRNIPEARRLLMVIGTEAGRQLLGENVWVDIVKEQWTADGYPNAVITDMRFKNEVSWVEQAGGTTVQIIRPENPVGVDTSHVSEANNFICQYVVNNSGTLEQLADQTDRLLEEITNG